MLPTPQLHKVKVLRALSLPKNEKFSQCLLYTVIKDSGSSEIDKLIWEDVYTLFKVAIFTVAA